MSIERRIAMKSFGFKYGISGGLSFGTFGGDAKKAFEALRSFPMYSALNITTEDFSLFEEGFKRAMLKRKLFFDEAAQSQEFAMKYLSGVRQKLS